MACWKKVRELGSGSYGTVYLGHLWGSPDHPIAVKSAGESPERYAVESLEREAAALRHLEGAPNVIQCFENEHTTELLLEYAPYGSLYDVIGRVGAMPEWKVACYAKMLLTGIQAIHSRGLAHCDLKSENILAFPGRNDDIMELKIADLGLCKWASEGFYEDVPKWVGLWGDRYYNRGTDITSSPESIVEGYHGPCADIWSIGCIVYEMMTGSSVWEWNGHRQYLYDQILENKISYPKHLSQDALYFLMCCFKHPETRWSAEQLLRHPFILENIRTITTRPSQSSAAPCYYNNTSIINHQSQLLV